MADENTTASTPTPTPSPAPDPSPDPVSPDTSTTDPQPDPQPEPAPTILTPKADPDPDPDAPTETDEQKAEREGKEAEHAKLFGAPEGDYEVTGLPEGMAVDKVALEVFTPVAKELGLSNEGMSKVVSVYAEKVLPIVTQQVVDGIQQDVVATHAQWATETNEMLKTDAAFEGKKLSEVQQVAAKTLDRFGGPDFRSFLEETGIGNHPAMVKMAYLVGTAISEDTTFERGNTAPKPKTSVEKFYGQQT